MAPSFAYLLRNSKIKHEDTGDSVDHICRISLSKLSDFAISPPMASLLTPPLSLSPSPPSHPQNFFSSTQFLQPHMAAAAMDQTHHQFHVLAVDDSIIDRKLIERLLKTSSYQVTAVDSGSKALEFLGLTSEGNNDDDEASVSPGHDDHNNNQVVGVNMIITDYCMPGMTGYDLLRKIKGSASLKDIPVVIMSSENVPSRINRCLEDGAEEFFLKPVQLSDVNKLRPHLLKRSREAEPNNCNNKRKGMEEIDSPDRTRTRYNGSD